VDAITNPTPRPFTLTLPANAATGVNPEPTLTWQESVGAVCYVLHIGTTTPPGNQNDQLLTSTSFRPKASPIGALRAGTRYYWSVEAVGSDDSRTLNTGGIQSFTVA
jgi:hypothetical protein